MRSLIRRSATCCVVTIYRRRRSANAGPPGQNSFGSTSRCSQGRTIPRPRSLCEDWWPAPCCFFIYLESSRIDISRITNCPNKPWKLRVTRNVRIRGRGTRQRCYALQHRDTIYFTSFQATRAPPVRNVSVGAERSMVAPANECLSKVIFFGDRSSHRMTKSHTERNHQGKSTISLLRQVTDTRCEEAARSRERRSESLRSHQQDAA